MLRKLLSQHATACFFAGISGGLCIGRFGKAFLTTWIPYPVVLALVALFLLVAWVSGIAAFWKKNTDESIVTTTGFWQDATRYFFSMNMIMAGLQKFVRLQFDVPLRIFDQPFKDLQGDLLVASFFSRSMPFFHLIGALEIITALMLIFRRTQLLGVILMLPILLNIQLINIFYAYNVLMSIDVTFLLTVCIYLILLEYSRLKNFFFIAQNALPQFNFKNKVIKNAVRFSVVYIPIILLIICQRYPRHYPEIFGKYVVSKYTWGDSTVKPRAQIYHSDSVLTKVYLDSYALVLEYNNVKRRFAYDYRYDAQQHSLKAVAISRNNLKPDSLFATIKTVDPDHKIITGNLRQKKFTIQLQQVSY